MVSLLPTQRCGPIGVDLGAHSVKLLQFSADHSRVIDASRWDLAPQDVTDSPEARREMLVDALCQARDGHKFRGRDAVLCLGSNELFVQNVRVAKTSDEDLATLVHQEAVNRVPFDVAEAEIRYLSAADVRQGDIVKREVILLACHRPALEESLSIIEQAGLHPVAVDVEPSAVLRSYAKQFRRDEDLQQRAMFVHLGASNTVVVIAQGEETLFVKYLGIGGRHLDEAVARRLEMPPAEAAAMRRHNGDRRTDQQDPEVARGVSEAIRPVFDSLCRELSLCVRYHSVTFRGQPLARMVLSGGEATPALAEIVGQRLDLKCEVGNPLRSYHGEEVGGRAGQWDVAAGLALREVEL